VLEALSTKPVDGDEAIIDIFFDFEPIQLFVNIQLHCRLEIHVVRPVKV
jgi:hypothetical protein